MIKLGDTIDVTNAGENTSKMWLVKQPSLKKYTDKIYVVLGFIRGKGWYTASNGTLKEMRAYMEKCR